MIANYTVEITRTWHCTQCGMRNVTEVPNGSGFMEVMAICEGCGADHEWGEEANYMEANYE